MKTLLRNETPAIAIVQADILELMIVITRAMRYCTTAMIHNCAAVTQFCFFFFARNRNHPLAIDRCIREDTTEGYC